MENWVIFGSSFSGHSNDSICGIKGIIMLQCNNVDGVGWLK